MKQLFSLTTAITLVFCSGSAFCQDDKPPTQAEIQAMMKQAQKELNNLDPATRRTMDSLGIKMPDMNKAAQKLSKISDAQLKEEWENQTRLVPKRDAARIAAIPAAVSMAGMGAYIRGSQDRLFARLQPAVRTVGEKIYASYKSGGKSAAAIGNAAAALWMTGRTQTAFYLMSKTCADDPSNADNISNYASMLSMLGAEQVAIPILQNLNSRFPHNATILNNLGQAWFGLGETVKAEKYLDSSILVFGAGTQATLTKAKIQESKGNKTDAVTLVKQSARTAYSAEKEEYLRKLGSELGSDDLHLPRPTHPDPMNLGAFMPPPFPKSVMECVLLQPQWQEFDKLLEDNIGKLTRIQQTEAKARTEEAVRQTLAGRGVPLHLTAAHRGLEDASETFQRKLEAFKERVVTFSEGRGKQLTDVYEKTMARLKKEDNDQTGEGKRNEDYCPRYQKVTDEYLKAMNTEMEEQYKELLSINKVYLNESAYYSMYATFPEEFEALKPGFKASWLTVMKNSHVFKSITAYVCDAEPETRPSNNKLAEFDDVACQYHSSMSYVVGTISVDCSRMETTLDLGSLKLGLKQNMDKEGFGDQFVSCTVAVSAGVGTKIGGAGPLEVGVGADVTGIVEIDRSGVKDVVVEGSVGVTAGSTVISDAGKSLGTGSKVAGHGVGDGSATVGVNGRISLVSGASSGDFSFSRGGGFK